MTRPLFLFTIGCFVIGMNAPHIVYTLYGGGAAPELFKPFADWFRAISMTLVYVLGFLVVVGVSFALGVPLMRKLIQYSRPAPQAVAAAPYDPEVTYSLVERTNQVKEALDWKEATNGIYESQMRAILLDALIEVEAMTKYPENGLTNQQMSEKAKLADTLTNELETQLNITPERRYSENVCPKCKKVLEIGDWLIARTEYCAGKQKE